MKKEELYDGITDIKDEFIEGAYLHTAQKRRKNRRKWLLPIVAVVVFSIITGAVFWPSDGGQPSLIHSYAVTEAVYPERVQYPRTEDFTDENGETDWDAYNAAQDLWSAERSEIVSGTPKIDSLNDYLKTSIPTFLNVDNDKNRIYSPLNVYMALAMLAELTDGESRKQILELTGADNIQALRTTASALWNATYRQDGIISSKLASSLWMNKDFTFKKDTLEKLASIYYASSYQGEMGSADFNTALQNWMDAQTGGILKEQISAIEMSAETILSLTTTISFQAKWTNPFSEGHTVTETFHAPNKDVTCEFMKQSMGKVYFWGEDFTATSQQINSGGEMWFILPDEGVSVDKLLEDAQTMEFLLAGDKWSNQKYVTVNLSVPKFDVSSDIDLKDGLQTLGVNNVFNPQKSDFTPMTEDTDGIFVSEAKHAARVMIDEEGCTAAAFTVMMMDGTGGPPPDEVDFTLNRPFVFAVTGSGGLPLFIGVVNQP